MVRWMWMSVASSPCDDGGWVPVGARHAVPAAPQTAISFTESTRAIPSVYVENVAIQGLIILRRKKTKGDFYLLTNAS